MKELVFAGFGGQGILTAGLLVSQIALYKGYNATWMPAYGAAMRGGTANCTVKYGEEEIYNPGQQKPDLLLCMNKPSYLKFQNLVKPGAILLANGDMISKDVEQRSDIKIAWVNCNTLADKVKNTKGANIVMVGAIVRLLGDFTEEEGINAMTEMFNKKGKNKFEQLNIEAFKEGYNAFL
jgi:2-oxoglutarate ferredoxin oxidoreductase subunit gamma